MKLPHPSDIAGNIQIIYWNVFKLDTVYEVEIINYFNAPSRKNGVCAYTDFCAIALHDYPEPLILKDDMFLMSVSYKCFVRALQELHPLIRKSLNRADKPNTNVIMKFVKIGRGMKILELKQKDNTPELEKQAVEEYDKINLTKRIFGSEDEQ